MQTAAASAAAVCDGTKTVLLPRAAPAFDTMQIMQITLRTTAHRAVVLHLSCAAHADRPEGRPEAPKRQRPRSGRVCLPFTWPCCARRNAVRCVTRARFTALACFYMPKARRAAHHVVCGVSVFPCSVVYLSNIDRHCRQAKGRSVPPIRGRTAHWRRTVSCIVCTSISTS